jgi:hypothetical protein
MIPGQPEKLFGVKLTGKGPEPRSRAARQYNGDDHVGFLQVKSIKSFKADASVKVGFLLVHQSCFINVYYH